ncbi:PREDICTED: retinol dehydrogenase 14-like [Nicrophorus vespilloides]|uniref:Retinol dehydrogenase 14-like n=1 Tax=Nicrophorus vespilloides TaxID=110193 RepID=A0ABM1M4N4_NICVS|nr:PREDICTED: retinol dehydrogenase 14-like [Nicrophorus vespilloides]
MSIAECLLSPKFLSTLRGALISYITELVEGAFICLELIFEGGDMMIFVYVCLILAVGLVVTRLYLTYTRWPNCMKCLLGKTCIVTGSNTGIGYYTALDFAMRGGRVILACRNEEKANEAQKKIIEATGNKNVHVRLVNFASLDSVRAFCEEFNRTEEKLDILVNNAGAVGTGNKKTKDGIMIQMQINYFAPFLLTHLLIGKLLKAENARVVNVSSLLSYYGQLDLEHFNEYPFSGNMTKSELTMYYTSKQCEVLFTRELARRLRGTRVTCNALHPGSIMTDIWRNVPNWYKPFLIFIISFIFKTPHQGAQTSIYCALSDDLNDVTGMWFENAKITKFYPSHLDDTLGKKLWTRSEEMVKLRSEEMIPENGYVMSQA